MIKRILSALILIPVVIWLVMFADYIYLGAALLFVSMLSYLEWLNMDQEAFNIIKSIYFALAALFIFVLIFYPAYLIYVLFFDFIASMVLSFSSIEKEKVLQNYYSFGGILYVSLYSFLFFLIKQPNGRAILMLVFISIWAGDSFAYFCGRKFGKTKMAKFISPKKTYEGAVCGIVLGTLLGAVFAYFVHIELSKGFIIAVVANIVGIFGDLAESVIKRAFNKKDSSNLIPGHGGIMDRLDSVAFAGFFVYIITSWKIL